MTWENMTKTQKLIWLKKLSGDGAKLTTVTGYAPITLATAANKNIKSLIQQGIVSIYGGNPSWTNPTTLLCNYGAILPKKAGTSYTDPTVFDVSGTAEIVKIYHNSEVISSATVEILLASQSLSNAVDTQDIITGEVKRRNAIIVLDGTENFGMGNMGSGIYFYLGVPSAAKGNKLCACTHSSAVQTGTWNAIIFKNFTEVDDPTDLNGLKQYLAEQYANGTPVMAVYPLDPDLYYTETVPSQEMRTVEGDNVLSLTKANPSSVGKKTVEYYKSTSNKYRPIVGTGQVGYAVI